MRILFARHGESEANLQKIISNRDLHHPLTDKGISQASALAERLSNSFQVKTIWSSPILRAKETAEIVAKKLELPLKISPALREFDCGMLEGRTDPEAWNAYRKLIRAWDEDQAYKQRILPDGESFNDLKTRFVPFINGLFESSRALSGDILLITHGGLLYQMLPLVVSNIDRAYTKANRLGNCDFFITQPHEGKLVHINNI